ncbi:MAG: hypothetical protein RLZZ457_1750 [Pseudomonadota bacterium]|jgi:two-component system response regulator FixJ
MAQQFTNLSISVVEDNDDLRTTLVDLLEADGFSASGFIGVEEFLPSLATTQPHLIVCDLQMEGCDGFDLIDRIKGAGLNIPVILMSGTSNPNMRTKALSRGAAVFLQKPFDFSALLNAFQFCSPND